MILIKRLSPFVLPRENPMTNTCVITQQFQTRKDALTAMERIQNAFEHHIAPVELISGVPESDPRMRIRISINEEERSLITYERFAILACAGTAYRIASSLSEQVNKITGEDTMGSFQTAVSILVDVP
jgi:hypothetical protein